MDLFLEPIHVSAGGKEGVGEGGRKKEERGGKGETQRESRRMTDKERRFPGVGEKIPEEEQRCDLSRLLLLESSALAGAWNDCGRKSREATEAIP